jgi:RecB family exonuclease
VNWLRSTFDKATVPDQSNLDAYLDRHKEIAVHLTAGPETGSDAALWDKKAGQAVQQIFEQLSYVGQASGDLSKFEYLSIFRAQVGLVTVREDGYVPDKRVAIWGQLEARVQSADLIILGGLNEGTWPKLPSPDPWLSRNMRRSAGLQPPERRIGLSAHDFQQAIANKNVILSRALKVDNTPTVASRWITRLENLLTGIGQEGANSLAKMKLRGNRFVSLAQIIDQPLQSVPAEPRPCPAPPLEARPEQISVTQVERLIRDPYAIYAEKILRLRPLPELGRSADARDRGTSFHKVLENFIDAVAEEVPANARDLFDKIALRTLNSETPWPSERRIWLGRLLRVADSFVKQERERRQIASPLLREEKAHIPIPGFSRPLTLTCKADRIDQDGEGYVAIYDYKSSIPSDKQERQFSKQLELEAHMAIMGGFEKLGRVRAKHLEIIGLSKPGDTLERDSNPDTIAEIWGEFLKIITHFEAPENGYSARLRPMREALRGDFDHLARRGEWEDNDTPIVRLVP